MLDSIIFGLQQFGGVSNYWVNIIRFMRLEPGFSSTLLFPAKVTFREYDESLLGGGRVVWETLDARVTRYLRASFGRGGDIFHTSYYRRPSGRFGKYVVSVYDFTYERYRTGLARYVHSWQKRNSIVRADAIICISESTRRDVLEFCPGVDPAAVHVVYLGVDTNAFYREAGFQGPENERLVLFVGKRAGYKRFDLAVEALRQTGDLVLGIVGPALTEAERVELQLRLGSRWKEFGPVPRTELRQLYTTSFAFIFPSDYEGFGLPILEAMACGCPVVAANASSLPEVGGDAAIYADRQDGASYASALSLLGSGTTRDNAIAAGIRRVQAFTWEKTFLGTKAVYLAS